MFNSYAFLLFGYIDSVCHYYCFIILDFATWKTLLHLQAIGFSLRHLHAAYES